MKIRAILFFILFIFSGKILLGEDPMVEITIGSSTDRSRNVTKKNLPPLSDIKGISALKLVIDNKCNDELLLKVQGENNVFRQVQIKKTTKAQFSIVNTKFSAIPGDSLPLGQAPVFTIKDKDGNLIVTEQIILKEKVSNADKPRTKSVYKIGQIYYDAKYLASQDSNVTVQNEILNYYGYDTYYGSMNTRLRMLGDEITKKLQQPLAQGAGSGAAATGLSLLSSVANYDVTNLADGIARFLVKRVKEELSIAFFQHFKDVLDRPPTSDLKYLFPTTYDILHSIDHEIYNWDNYITTLRDAFDKDISNLVPNLETFEARAAFLKSFRENTACHVSARFALFVAKDFTDHVHAGQLLDDFDADEYIRPTEKDAQNARVQWVTFNLSNCVKTLQLVSASLRSRDDEEYWIKDAELKELLNNDAVSGYFNLLFWLKAKKENIRFRKSESDPSQLVYLCDQIDEWSKLKPVISGFAIRVKDFRSSFAKMKTAVENAKSDSAKARISYIDLYPFIQSSMNIVRYADETMVRLKIPDLIPEFRPVLQKSSAILDLVTKGGELGMDLSLKRYSAAIADLVYLINGSSNLMANGNQQEIKSAEKSNDLKVFTENLVKYGTFMASVANAKSSEEVEKVIQNHALPTGSSRIKRESAFNVSLNAYTGLYLGYEQISGVDPGWSWNYQKINSFGVTAPLGIAISIGKRKLFNANWSYSLFISAIDVGAIASFRFKNDSVASVPTILLKDILSPGVFFSIGFPKCPLSLNLGVQAGPNLRKVSEPSEKNPDLQNNYANSIYWRYSVSLCVDIPIFNFVNKLDRKKQGK